MSTPESSTEYWLWWWVKFRFGSLLKWFKPELLKAHFEIFTFNFITPDVDRTAVTLWDFIASTMTLSLTEAQEDLMSEVCILLKFILVMQATNAMSKWSFSPLQRIKTYLQTTMTEYQLNNLMALNITKNFVRS